MFAEISPRLSAEAFPDRGGGASIAMSPGELYQAWLRDQPDFQMLRFSPDQSSILRPWETELPDAWKNSGSGPVIQSWSLWPTLDPNRTVALGGLCSLFPADRRRIRSGEIKFGDIADFERWFRSWYPRLDQIHDTVGVPPKAARGVCYVVEDSIWARRISADTKGKLDPDKVARVLRGVHEEQGAPLVKRWLSSNGYRGEVQVVYTSDLEPAMRAELRSWQRLLGSRMKPGQLDDGLVKLMYTGFWIDVLNISDPVVIFEPFHHFQEVQEFTAQFNPKWFGDNPYCNSAGVNRNLAAIGFAPAAAASGFTRGLPLECVPHVGNWREFNVREEDAALYGITLFPRWALNRAVSVPVGEMQERVRRSLSELFGV